MPCCNSKNVRGRPFENNNRDVEPRDLEMTDDRFVIVDRSAISALGPWPKQNRVRVSIRLENTVSRFMDVSSSSLEEDVINPKLPSDELTECTFAAKRKTRARGCRGVWFATLQLQPSALLRALPKWGHVETVVITGGYRLTTAEIW